MNIHYSLKYQAWFIVGIIALLLINVIPLFGQNIILNVPEWKDYYRREQLLGKGELNRSFLSLPFHLNDTIKKGLKWELMPVIFQQQYTTVHPDSKNDGLMIPANGYQAYISGGFSVANKFFSIQIMPEFVSAEVKWHRGYEGAPKFTPIYLTVYGLANANIDIPEYFGIDPYLRFNLGQSHLQFNVGKITLGISSENRWWGPGKYNSLLLSNTAPGFLHANIYSRNPISTFFGKVEFQILNGILEESGFESFQGLKSDYTGNPNYYPRSMENTYFNGAIFSFQPRWLKGLFIGASRVSQQYMSNLKKENGGLVFPVFSRWRNNTKTGIFNQRLSKINLLSSIFARYMFIEDEAELYFEYGRDRTASSSWAYLMSPDYSRAYIIGFQKLMKINNNSKSAFQLGVEITQIEKSLDTRIFAGGITTGNDWYQDNIVRQGYTHKGQFLGAGIGDGSNLYTVDFAWVNGLNKLGLKAERFAHNMDYFYWPIRDIRSAWVDIRGSIYGNILVNKALFNIEITGIDNYNYQYNFVTKDPNNFFADGENIFNLSVKFGLSIIF